MDQLLEQTYIAERDHFWFRGFRQFIAPLIDRALAGTVNPRALDCGCGTGNNLAVLRAHADAYGFDLTLSGLRRARSQGGQRVARASITHVPFASGHFDLVTSFDVLQCLTEEQETMAMQGMARVLKPGGALILNVAALEILRGDHARFSEEVRRYTKPMMQTALARAGLVPERITYTNFSIFPVMLATRTWQRWRNTSDPAALQQDMRVPAAPVNAAFAGLLSLEARALRVANMPIGSSLLVLARKPRP